mgnify:CR=1 FL=1
MAQDICKKIEALSSNHVGIVIAIFIPRQWEKLRSFKQEGEEFDLHDYIKAFSAQRNITTQIIEESTLNNINSYCQIFWWLSLAFYVKSMRTPWILANMPSNTAFAGIGYSIKKSPSGKNEIEVDTGTASLTAKKYAEEKNIPVYRVGGGFHPIRGERMGIFLFFYSFT